ncbi:MAG: hypothetical protein Q8Q23_06145 [bacterium]|nr:hypothetical protein [bacterium]
MAKRLIKIFLFLAIAGFVGYRYFYYVDRDSNCFIKIKPSYLEFSASNIKEGIKILKYAVPEEYEKLCIYVDTINPNISCGGFQGGCYSFYNDNVKEIDISTANHDFLSSTASVIAHETCHAIQFQTYGREGIDEKECYAVGNKVMTAVIDF